MTLSREEVGMYHVVFNDGERTIEFWAKECWETPFFLCFGSKDDVGVAKRFPLNRIKEVTARGLNDDDMVFLE